MQNISICKKCQGGRWLDDNKQVVRDAARVGVMGECGIPLSFWTRFDSHQNFIGDITATSQPGLLLVTSTEEYIS
jgi:hypothetical protein